MAAEQHVKIQVTPDGPYVVTGGVPLSDQTIEVDAEGTSRSWSKGRDYDAPAEYHLCRCGHSENKPFCDGHHKKVGFDGTETASRAAYLEQAEEIDGPDLVLTDATALCAFARFCDAGEGIWQQATEPGQRDQVRQEAANCVGGRLVAWQVGAGSAEALEPQVEPSIGVVHDPGRGVGGGYRVWGGIEVTSGDGTAYEVRNRVALCRCGQSRNKPFCDGSHAAVGFQG
jgi:CDGSH-type Zn-finger protein